MILQNKLNKLHERSKRPRLDGVKPAPKRDRPGQPRKYKKMFAITPMQSARVIDEITRAFLPEKIE